MKKTLLLLMLSFVCFGITLNAQTVDELKAQKAAKEDAMKALEGEIADLSKRIAEFPGWKYGAFGLVGVNFAQYNNWFPRGDASSTFNSNIGLTANAFANLDRDQYFWRNGANLNLGWTKLDLDTNDDVDADFESVNDAFTLNSLFGYKLTETIAASALGEYRTTVLTNFNSPGYLDIGIGATWTPITDLVVVVHPLNYNIVFSDSDFAYESSLGCKLVADYTKTLPLGLGWKSNLSAFISYKDVPNFSNWTWINSFNFKVFKGLGVGFELGLRGSNQEAYNSVLSSSDLITTENFRIDELTDDQKKVQTYWTLGLSYSL